MPIRPIFISRWILLVTLSLAAAGLTTLLWRETRVDVGLDVVGEGGKVPILVWGDRLGDQVRMDPVEDRFAFSRCFFVISPLDTRSSAGGIHLQTSDFVSAVPYPAEAWFRYGDLFVLGGGARRASIAWLGGPGRAEPVLVGHAQARPSRVWAWWKNEIVDPLPFLGQERAVSDAAPPLRRYHARVPRRALSAIRLAGIDSERETVARLYFGTLIPVLFSENESIPRRFIWGLRRPRFEASWSKPISFPLPAVVDQGGVGSFLFFGFLWLGGSVTAIGAARRARRVVSLCRHTPLPDRLPAPFSLARFLGYWLPCFSVWLLMLLCFYPGCMSPDSSYQWVQAHEMRFNSHHPVASTLYLRLVTWIWDSPAAVALLQVVLLSGLAGYGFSLLRRAGVHRTLVGGVYLVCLLSPRNANFAIVLWKDIPYTITLAGLTLLLMHLFLSARLRRRIWPWVVLGLLLGLTPFFRTNGIVVYLGLLPFLVLLFWKDGRRAWTAALLSAAFIGLVYFGVFSLLYISPGYSRPAYMMTARLAGLVYQDVPLAQEEYEFLDRVRSLEDRWHYQRWTADLTIFDAKYNETYAVENQARYQRFFLSAWARFPYIMIRNLYETTSSFYSPLPTRALELNTTGWLHRPEDSPGPSALPFFSRMREWILHVHSRTNLEPLRYFFWRPGLFFVLAVGAAWVLVVRLQDVRYGLVFLPVLLNTFSLVAGAITQDVRYQFPLTFSLGFLLCFAFLPKGKEDNVGSQRAFNENGGPIE